MDRLAVEPLAVRGDRLALDYLMFTSAAGDETPMLALIEVDESGLLSFASWHDEDARAAAVEELGARYVEGEGAEHADLVRVSAAWMRAVDQVDLDTLREIAAPGFVLVDRRALGWPTVDLDGFVDIQRAYGDIESRFLARTFQARGRVVLSASGQRGGRRRRRRRSPGRSVSSRSLPPRDGWRVPRSSPTRTGTRRSPASTS